MTQPRTAAEQLDLAIDRLLAAGDPARIALDAPLRPLLEVAGLLRTALVPIPAGGQLEDRVAGRIVARSSAPARVLAQGMRALSSAAQRELRHPARLLVTGAVSSAAVGVGVTAYAVWRGSRRSTGIGPRIVHR